MKMTQEEAERETRELFAAERERLEAPSALWSRIEAELEAPPARERARMRRRWPALAFTVGAAAAIAIGLFILVERLGDGGPRTGNDVLAAAVDALHDPASVGLYSYWGVVEFTEVEVEPDRPPWGDLRDFDPSGQPVSGPPIVEAQIPDEPESESGRWEIWFESPDRYRFEFVWQQPGQPMVEFTMVTDGTDLWCYVGASNRYSRAPADSSRMSCGGLSFAPAMILGGSDIGSFLVAYSADTGREAVLAGEDTFLGRPVYVVEITPAWESSRSGLDGEEIRESGGVVRLWLDKEFLFTLRIEQPSGAEGGSFEMRFTEIELNGELDDDVFRFTPPDGAVEVSPEELEGGSGTTGSGSGVSGNLGQQVDLPAGFLAPTYYPFGYEARSVWHSSTQEDRDEDPEFYEAKFLIREVGGEGFVSAHERHGRGDLPAALKQGEPVTVRGNQAWVREDGDLYHLSWQEGELVVYMIGRGLPRDELLRMAESMQVSDGSGLSGLVPEDRDPSIPVKPGPTEEITPPVEEASPDRE